MRFVFLQRLVLQKGGVRVLVRNSFKKARNEAHLFRSFCDLLVYILL